jgi:hypothetical protein
LFGSVLGRVVGVAGRVVGVAGRPGEGRVDTPGTWLGLTGRAALSGRRLYTFEGRVATLFAGGR